MKFTTEPISDALPIVWGAWVQDGAANKMNVVYSVKYSRQFNWKDLEPKQGQFNFTKIDDFIESCKAAKCAPFIRYRWIDRPSGTGKYNYCPSWWPESKGKWVADDQKSSRQIFFPNENDADFIAAQDRVIKALAERYDGLIVGIDLPWGMWGEGHDWSVRAGDLATEETVYHWLDTYLQAFKKTFIFIQAREEYLVKYVNDKYPNSKQIGIRVDNGGVSGAWASFGRTKNIKSITDKWYLRGPVVIETEHIGRPNALLEEQADYYRAVVTTCNLGDGWKNFSSSERDRAARLGTKFPPRIRLVELTIDGDTDKLVAGAEVTSKAVWENTGRVPTYLRWKVRYRIVNVKTDQVEATWDSTIDLTSLAPDSKVTTLEKFVVPKLPAGEYRLSVRAEPVDFKLAGYLHLSMAGRVETTGSYPLGTITIVEAGPEAPKQEETVPPSDADRITALEEKVNTLINKMSALETALSKILQS